MPNPRTRTLLLITTSIFLEGCALLAFAGQFNCENAYVHHEQRDYPLTSFPINRKLIKTKLGIRVDTSGKNPNSAEIDRQILELEACLGVHIKKCGFVVKIAPEHETSDSGVQYFECNVRGEIKMCTGANQYPSAVVTTEDLRSLKHEMIHRVLNAKHGDPAFAKCKAL